MELWVLVTAYLCWLVYVFCLSVLMLRNGRITAGEMICVLMGNQAGVAEWFLRSVCGSEGVMTGRLAVAVAVDEGDEGTSGIVRILAGEKGFYVVSREDLPGLKRNMQKKLLIDVRGMNKKELAGGPLLSIRKLGIDKTA